MAQFDVAIPAESHEKVYVGRRLPTVAGGRGQVVVTIQQGMGERRLEPIGEHSPDGFEWGYGGSGPAELALAILADHLDCEPPAALYQAFKAAVVANLNHFGWQLRASEIAGWLGRNLRGDRG